MELNMTLYTRHAARLVLTCSLAFAASTIFGCDTDVAEGKAHAKTSAPASVPAPATKSVDTVDYVFSNADSKIEFTGAKVTGKHEGSIGRFNGTIHLTSGDPTKSRVGVELDMSSLRADVDKLTEHLKSADFFDVAKFPVARFESTSVRAGGENGATDTITGNLELHGVTKSISFPATIKPRGDSIDVDAEFAIDRQDFGVAYPGMSDDLIKDQILLKLTVRAKRSS
jgi:polyisoprenoid-binding protein YceI